MGYGEAAASVTYHGRKCGVWLFDVGDAPLSGRYKWINIARVGSWKGHGAGEFEFTEAVFDSLIANAKRRQTNIDIDYDHKSRNADDSGPSISAGQITKLEKRNGGKELWALCKLTPRAADHVAKEEIRGCSPVVAFDATDRASGKSIGPELLQLALTNNPFLDGLKAFEDVHEMTMVAAMAEETKPEEKPKDDAAEGGKSEEKKKDDAETVEMAAAPVDASALVSAIADASGVSADAVLGILMDKIDAVTKLVTDNAGDGTVADGKPMSRGAAAGANKALEVQLSNLTKICEAQSKRIEAMQKRQEEDDKKHAETVKLTRENAIKARVDAMVKSQAITEDEREGAVFMFTHDEKLAEKTYASRKPLIGTTQAGEDPPRKGTESVTLDGLTEAEKVTVTMLTAGGSVTEEEATQIVALTRDGTKPVEAARKVAAKRAAKG